jgi:hypothetical protein
MPPGAIIKKVRANKGSGYGNAVAANYELNNDGNTMTYATLPAVASVSAGFGVEVDDIYLSVPANDRTLRFRDTSANNPGVVNPQTATCFLLIEYY